MKRIFLLVLALCLFCLSAAVIANVMDRREREYESDTAGMLGRSTNDFIKALIKK